MSVQDRENRVFRESTSVLATTNCFCTVLVLVFLLYRELQVSELTRQSFPGAIRHPPHWIAATAAPAAPDFGIRDTRPQKSVLQFSRSESHKKHPDGPSTGPHCDPRFC